MKTKILIPTLLLGGIAAFLSFRYIGNSAEDPATKSGRRALVLSTVVKTITEGHFQPHKLDDSLSLRVYNKVLDVLDYEKKFFTADMIADLEKSKYDLDDQIRDSKTAFFDKVNGYFVSSIDRAERISKEVLDTPFRFDDNEEVQLAGDKLAWAGSDAALKERWRLALKFRVLSKYSDLLKEQEAAKKGADTAAIAKLTAAELEVKARESVRKSQDSYFRRLRGLDEDERFTLYVNAFSTSHDPHTDYFPPKDKQRFDESMSGTFIGIGASLRDEDGKIMVAAIIPGSPSWKEGSLRAGDEIQRVAQGPAEPEDIQGFDIDQVVSKIRGPKGSEVRLTVKKIDGSIKVISIIRKEVSLEETFAKSSVIQSPEGPVGYISLPEFYADFNHLSGRRSGTDVAKEVEKLKAAGVKGIILDLRNNGGGSLSDVVDIAGLFIDAGPIVQVKSSDAAPMTLRDNSRGTLYDGPLAIMVNQGSASASEIMAAAMQDYGRAVIIGSPTYGKGTVQKVASLDEALDPISRMKLDKELGALKITVQKFYRVNGGSTQLRGVTPDILLPDLYQYIDMGERRDKAALAWDEIPKANYSALPTASAIRMLESRSRQRTSATRAWELIDASAKRLKAKEDDNRYSLNLQKFRQEGEEASAFSKQLDELLKKGTPLTATNLNQDLERVNSDTATKAKNAAWLRNLGKDLYLSETVNIVADMIRPDRRMSAVTPGEKKAVDPRRKRGIWYSFFNVDPYTGAHW